MKGITALPLGAIALGQAPDADAGRFRDGTGEANYSNYRKHMLAGSGSGA